MDRRDRVMTEKGGRVLKLVQEAFAFNDDQLANEFDQAWKLRDTVSDIPVPTDEFSQIMERMKQRGIGVPEKNIDECGSERKVLRLKSMWKPALLVASLCVSMFAMGISVYARKELGEMWVRLGIEDNAIYFGNTDEPALETEGVGEAYRQLEDIGVMPLKMMYLPTGTTFSKFKEESGHATIELEYEGFRVHLVQIKQFYYSTGMINSDRSPYKQIYNPWLNVKLALYKNEVEGLTEFSTYYHAEDSMYYLSGIMDEETFIKVVANLSF